MKDNAFQRRRDIERMLLSGKKLTTLEMMKMFGVGRKAIRRDFDIIGEELPVITKQGYDGGYLLTDGVGQHQNTLTQEQLECLEKVAVTCGSEDRKNHQYFIRQRAYDNEGACMGTGCFKAHDNE